ncbi:RHS repeat domain-containing protein [Bergeyella sp. RCAD1439]|uniref:RHS repeat domain-containing protein n=1 Tax=Bergeyella anatis TaxID=3113737 RepID=UPI002E19E1AB|nr:RHS repeat-associated core domain-containing protein [Bergeyella sp. RCAD1439]
MHCQTVIKRRNAFWGFVGATTETRRSDDGAVRNKKRLSKWQKHPHALSILKDTTTPKPRTYEYDGNGNPISYEGFKDFRVMVWDEENRLQGLNDNGKLHLYTYDHTGERAVKSSAESQKTVINGVSSAVIVHAENYTAYVNPYFVVNKGKFTKHYFEGTSRIVSKLGEGTFHQPSGLMAGGIDYIKQSAKVQEAIDSYIRGLNVPPGPPTQHGIYGTPDFTGVEYPSIDWSDISQDQEPPEGWPRPPKFNEPGDVPGPPVQYGDPVKPETVEGGFGFKDNGVEEKNLYYYHPDHLGSSSYITDANGDVNQHTEYMAFGEVLFDEHKVSRRMPYLFNGKELDSETGLYYYGARYYDPRVSLWLNVDPHAERYPSWSPYNYVMNNPINAVDPDGRDVILLVWAIGNGGYGHAAVAVSNYKKEYYKVKVNGKTITKSRMVADGTYTYYDLWPGVDNNGDGVSDGIGSAGPKDAFTGPIAHYQVFKNLTENDLINGDPSGAEGKVADGVIKLYSGYQEDMEAIADIKSHMKSNKQYTSVTNNCSDLACAGVAEALDRYKWWIEDNGANESSYGINYTTPNALYKYVRDRINGNPKEGKELRNPGSVIYTKFKEAVIDPAKEQQKGN